MKLNKIIYMLSVILIIVTGTMCTSCSSEEQPQIIKSDNNIVPDQLEGFYISPNDITSTMMISESNMVLKFNPFIERDITFLTKDVITTKTDKAFIVEYTTGVKVIFEYIGNSEDVTVVYDDNGVIYKFGQFTKQ